MKSSTNRVTFAVGDAWLAASAAARARERRRIAREELTSMAAPDLVRLPDCP